MPAPPDTSHLRELRDLDGNAFILGLYNESDRLREEMQTWTAAAEEASARRPAWERLRRLLRHVGNLAEGGRLREQADAVERSRGLLDEPDPVPPLLSGTTDLLRAAANEAHQRYAEAFDAEMSKLEGSEPWQTLGAGQREEILRSNGLSKRERLRLESAATVLDALNAMPLSEWESLAFSLPERFGRALGEAARRLEPTVVRVKPRGASLKTEADVDEYLGELRVRIMGHINEGRPVVL